jgi:hypothetical protein
MALCARRHISAGRRALVSVNGRRDRGDDVTTTDNNNAAPSVWKRAWPLVGLAAAVLVNVLWLGVLGYELVRLL